MPSLHISSLIRPNVLIFLDIQGSNWETWLAQIRSDAIICDVWQYIDPSIPHDQIPALNPPAPVPPQGFFTRADVEEAEKEANRSNNLRVASDWAVSRILAYDRVREWRVYDERMYSLRVIKAFILATVPLGWVMYQGVLGGGPFGDVRRLLGSLSERVGVMRANRRSWVIQGSQRRAAATNTAAAASGGGSARVGVRVGTGTVGAAGGGPAGAGVGAGGTGETGARAGTGTVTAPVATDNDGFHYEFPMKGYWN